MRFFKKEFFLKPFENRKTFLFKKANYFFAERQKIIWKYTKLRKTQMEVITATFHEVFRAHMEYIFSHSFQFLDISSLLFPSLGFHWIHTFLISRTLLIDSNISFFGKKLK